MKNQDFMRSKFILKTNNTKTVALGVFTVKKKPTTRINLNVSLLRDVIDLLDASEHEYIDLCTWGNDFPVLFGTGNAGVMIAPRQPDKDQDRCVLKGDIEE